MNAARLLGLAVALGAISGSCLAATLDQIEGAVLVNGGSGYAVMYGPVELKLGDTILANPGASAVLTCDDGTAILIEPGKVTTVCETDGMTTITQGEGSVVGPEGGVAEGGIAEGGGGLGSLGSGTLVIGGLAVAAGAAAIAGISSGSDSAVSGQ